MRVATVDVHVHTWQRLLRFEHRDGVRQTAEKKNNTSYNRFQKIISILSVRLTIEAILCVYGRKGKTG